MVGRIFLSTPSARRATKASFLRCTPFTRFLSTPSARRATATPAPWMACGTYFYPRPPRGGRQIVSALAFTCNIISIHALREEGDPPCAAGRGSLWNFYPRPPRGGRPATTSLTSTHKGISIHALREEGDTYGSTSDQASTLFLSTPSARRATRCRAYDNSIDEDFYPRPPRGGRRLLGGAAVVNDGISIHALREEGDAGPLDLCHLRFISIHALREEGDRGQRGQLQVLHISIHALREEGDFLRIRKQVLRA